MYLCMTLSISPCLEQIWAWEQSSADWGFAVVFREREPPFTATREMCDPRLAMLLACVDVTARVPLVGSIACHHRGLWGAPGLRPVTWDSSARHRSNSFTAHPVLHSHKFIRHRTEAENETCWGVEGSFLGGGILHSILYIYIVYI